MPYDAPDMATLSLAQIAELSMARKLPPVAQWNPKAIGESEMQIAANGQWFHEGAIIKRPAMVRAFSSLLRLENDGAYWLVTPQEKLRISVEDAPFLAVEMSSEGEGYNRSIAFRLNTDEFVVSGPKHPITIRDAIPYVEVRDGLMAKCTRSVYYALAEIALSEAGNPTGLWSNGAFFPLKGSE
jgi:uncharacterized protein